MPEPSVDQSRPAGPLTQPSAWITVIGVAYTVLAVAALSRSSYQAATGWRWGGPGLPLR